MTPFAEYDALEPVPGTDDYTRGEDLVWELFAKGSGVFFIVKAGTRFNLSVPGPLEKTLKLLRFCRMTGFMGRHDRRILPPAALHDEILKLNGDVFEASAVMRRACRARGVGIIFSFVIYAGTLLWTARK